MDGGVVKLKMDGTSQERSKSKLGVVDIQA